MELLLLHAIMNILVKLKIYWRQEKLKTWEMVGKLEEEEIKDLIGLL